MDNTGKEKQQLLNILKKILRILLLNSPRKTAALAVLFLVLAADFIILIQNFSIYRNDIYMTEEVPENYVMYQMEPGVPVSQHFRTAESFLKELDLVLYNVGTTAPGTALVQVCTLQEDILFEQEISLQEMVAGEVTKIRTNLPVSAGTYYVLKITAVDTEEVPYVMLVERERNTEITGSLYLGEDETYWTLVAGYIFRSVDSYEGTVLVLSLLLVSGMVLLIDGLVFLPEFRREIVRIMTRHRLSQVLIMFNIIAAFLFAALCNGGATDALLINKLVCGGYVLCIYVINVFYVYRYYFFPYIGKKKKTLKKLEKEWNRWKDRKFLLLLLLAAFLMRVWMIGTIPRWDAGEYYYRLGTACNNFAFTWDSFWENFRLANHTSLGFSLVMAIGEFLNPRGVAGVQIVNLILTLAAVCCLYGLFKNYWLKVSDGKAAYFAFIVSVTPLFLGTFSYINVDYVMAVFFIYLMYSEYRENYILMAFWAVMMTQTKESGMVVAFGYFAVRLLYGAAIKSGTIREKACSVLEDKGNWSGAAVGICIVLNMLLQSGLTTWG